MIYRNSINSIITILCSISYLYLYQQKNKWSIWCFAHRFPLRETVWQLFEMVGRWERWRQTGSYTEKGRGIERRGRNKENERDSINKRPLPYCLWLQHYPLEQPTNPHRWLPETIKCPPSAMITNLMAKIISTEIICGDLCSCVFLLGHKRRTFHQTMLSAQCLLRLLISDIF